MSNSGLSHRIEQSTQRLQELQCGAEDLGMGVATMNEHFARLDRFFAKPPLPSKENDSIVIHSTSSLEKEDGWSRLKKKMMPCNSARQTKKEEDDPQIKNLQDQLNKMKTKVMAQKYELTRSKCIIDQLENDKKELIRQLSECDATLQKKNEFIKKQISVQKNNEQKQMIELSEMIDEMNRDTSQMKETVMTSLQEVTDRQERLERQTARVGRDFGFRCVPDMSIASCLRYDALDVALINWDLSIIRFYFRVWNRLAHPPNMNINHHKHTWRGQDLQVKKHVQ